MSEEIATASLPPAGDPDTLYVLDVSSYVFRAYHALPPLSNSKGEPTHAVAGVAQMVQKFLGDCRPAYMVVAMDPKGGSFRAQVYDKYKANRPPPPPDLSQQIERVKQVLVAWGMLCLEKAGYEADDLIATVVKAARAKGLKVVVVSADKDLLQLVDGGVVMYDTMRNKVFGRAETLEKMGVPPEKVRDLLSLVGDASDNVPGVPSVGPKTATKLLEDFGDLDGIYANLDKIKAKGTKQKLEENKEAAYLSRDLVTLRDEVDVGFEVEKARFAGGHPDELRKLFLELEFTRALATLEPAKKNVEVHYELATSSADLARLGTLLREAGRFAVHTVVEGDDPRRGSLLGVGVSWAEGHASYVPLVGDAPGREAAIALLRPLLANSLLPKVTGDAKRELLAWDTVGVTVRGVAVDTMLASYLLEPDRSGHDLVSLARLELDAELPDDEALLGKGAKARDFAVVPVSELTSHAGQRADYALRLAKVLEPRMAHGEFPALYRELELPLASVLADLERTGIRVDADALRSMSAEVSAELERLEKRCTELAGHPFNVGSPRQLETILFDELGLPVVKKTKTARSTDQTVLEELALLHELPAAILEHRSLAKLQGTYIDALPQQIDPRTGRIHTRFNQAVAATGRISSSDPNLQNIPIRTELGRRIRNAFVPAEGMELLSADYSQIELRVLAHLSRDPELVDAYVRGDDVHARTATALFGVPKEEVTREQRGQAKTVNFAVIYGQTEFALARNLKIDRKEARRYIEAFFARYAGVKRFMDEVVAEADATGYVTTLFGRRRAVADIRSTNQNLRAAAERIARNTPIQGTAADILKRAMLAIHHAMAKQGLAARMLLTVHDELVFEAPAAEKAALEALVRSHMESAAELSVPLTVSVGWGPSWGAAH